MTRLEIIGWDEVSERRARLQPCRKDPVSTTALAAEVRFSKLEVQHEISERRNSGARTLMGSIQCGGVSSDFHVRGEGR